jgi:hypothetical protein
MRDFMRATLSTVLPLRRALKSGERLGAIDDCVVKASRALFFNPQARASTKCAHLSVDMRLVVQNDIQQ